MFSVPASNFSLVGLSSVKVEPADVLTLTSRLDAFSVNALVMLIELVPGLGVPFELERPLLIYDPLESVSERTVTLVSSTVLPWLMTTSYVLPKRPLSGYVLAAGALVQRVGSLQLKDPVDVFQVEVTVAARESGELVAAKIRATAARGIEVAREGCG